MTESESTYSHATYIGVLEAAKNLNEFEVGKIDRIELMRATDLEWVVRVTDISGEGRSQMLYPPLDAA